MSVMKQNNENTAAVGSLKGQCLCGSVMVEAMAKDNAVDACHCSMCRMWAAGPFFALPCKSVKIGGDDAVGTYRSSDWGQRIFCKNCGTSIAWQLHDGSESFVSANLFQETGDYPLELQVFIDEKPAYYDFAQTTKTVTGAEVFAMFGSSGENGQ